MKPLCRLLLPFFLCAVFSCKREKPVAEGPNFRLILGVENSESSKTNDFGGVISQSFGNSRNGVIVAVRFLIEGRENPRDLLVLLRHADENGYPIGEVLSSGLGTIIPSEERKAVWHEIQLSDAFEATEGESYCLELISSKPHYGYGYSEYAYSLMDAFPNGRLHTRGFSRRVPEDQGEDLCFAVVYEVPETEVGDESSALTQASPSIIEPTVPPAPDPLVEEAEKIAKNEPELTRLLGFLRMHHLDFDGRQGVRVQMWADLGKAGREGIVDEVITGPSYDIFYGHADNDQPMFHLIDGGGGGGTRYIPEMGRTHFENVVSFEEAFKKSVLIGKEYSSNSKIWLKLSHP